MNDNVTHPTHYTQGPVHPACGEVVECITVTQHHNFNVGNAIKYLWRADHKADALEDLAKAAQYIQFEIDRRKYEAARNEPPLFGNPFKHAHEVDLCPHAGGAMSADTHTSGHSFDVSPSFKALLYAMLTADKPDDEGHDEPDAQNGGN